MAQGGLAERLDAEMPRVVERELTAGEIPGASGAGVVGDRIVWSAGFGVANRWAGTPATPQTVYVIGSTFKSMVVAALMRQVDAGRIALDDPVDRYLDGLVIQGESRDHPITFRHLLTHTSGLGDAVGSASVWGDSLPLPVPVFLSHALRVSEPPLTAERYSNLAFVLVGHLIERLSGLAFRAYIRDSIWAPLAMSSTAFAPTPEMEERLAMPYVIDSATRRPVAAVRQKAVDYAAGMVYGTATDMAQWLVASLNSATYDGRRILTARSVAAMYTVQYQQFRGPKAGWGDSATGFGLGWWLADRDGHRYIAHSGSVIGYTAFVEGCLTHRAGVVILTNGDHAHESMYRIAAAAMRLADGA